MPLAQSASDISLAPQTETTIVSWTADGAKELVGFTGKGQWPAEYRLYSGATLIYKYLTSSADETAFVADKAFVPAVNVAIALKVYHEAPQAKTFFGTLLGG